MSKTDIVERTAADWRALAPESWDDDYRDLWVKLAMTNDRFARWRRDYRDACAEIAEAAAEIARLRTVNAELVEALAVSEKTLELTRRQHSLAMDSMADKTRAAIGVSRGKE